MVSPCQNEDTLPIVYLGDGSKCLLHPALCSVVTHKPRGFLSCHISDDQIVSDS